MELARLITGDSILELTEGETAGATFLMDMERVFGSFVRSALGEALRLSDSEWAGEGSSSRELALDEAGQIRLQPGMSWWEGRRCVFVGDAIYKGADDRDRDIHRMLAYCTAAGVKSGLLVYPSGQAAPAVHRVANAGIRIEVATIDITAGPQSLLEEVGRIADRVKAQRHDALAAGGYPARSRIKSGMMRSG